MTEKETRSQIIERVKRLETRFERRYEVVSSPDRKKCFRVNDGEYFMVTGLTAFGGVIIEHAFSKQEAEKNLFEDGDLFYLNEMDEDTMFKAMMREIEDN